MSDELKYNGRRYSFSQWESYDDCPQKWKFKSVDRLPTQPPGPAAARGLQIHDSIATYIQGGDRNVLHPDVHPDYVAVFDKYRDWPNGDRACERQFGVGPDWGVTGFRSGRIMAVFDVVGFFEGTLDIGEWKSGKPKDRHVEQRKLYAAVGLAHYPIAEKAVATTHYVEATAPSERVAVSQSGAKKIMQIWDRRMDEMDKNKICAPRPGMYCRWCDFSKTKGGPCKAA